MKLSATKAASKTVESSSRCIPTTPNGPRRPRGFSRTRARKTSPPREKPVPITPSATNRCRVKPHKHFDTTREDYMKTSLVFCAGLAGLAAGVFLALAFAPQSGKETQALVKQKTRQGLDRLAAGGKKVGGQLRDLADQGADLAARGVARGQEEVSDVLEAGRPAYTAKVG